MGKLLQGGDVYTFSQVDAFTDVPFRGNPAAVMEMADGFLPDHQLQAIAAEHNLAETSFWRLRAEQPSAPGELQIDLRWFTPTIEVELCGHATLACAHTVMESQPEVSTILCHTLSGILTVTKLPDGRLQMDFPAHELDERPELIQAVGAAVGAVPGAVLWREGQRDALALFSSPGQIRELQPDMGKLSSLPCRALICSAEGTPDPDGPPYDFVYRFFAPRCGINEDPTTGSAQCSLIPVWVQRLQKNELFSKQISARGGELWASLHKGEETRTFVSGKAVTVIKGEMRVPKAQ